MPDKAPDYKIMIGGCQLDIDPRHLSRLTVEDSIEQISRCEITISDSHDFVLQPSIVKLAMPVEVYLGYVGDLVKVFAGEIVEIVPEFPQVDLPSLTITAFDHGYKLKREIYKDRIFKNMTLLDIVRNIVENPEAEYPFDLVVAPEGPLIDYRLEAGQSIEQNEESDMDILSRLAEAMGYNLFVKYGIGTQDPNRIYLYFVKDEYLLEQQEAQYRFIYNAWPDDIASETDIRLLRFSPRLDLFDKRGKIEISNWITDLSDEIYAKAEVTDIIELAKEEIGNIFEGLEELLGIIDAKPDLPFQAKEQARQRLLNMLKNLVKGDATITGNPRVEIGGQHQIAAKALGGFGNQYSGSYFITQVKHRIDYRGFETSFSVRRMGISES